MHHRELRQAMSDEKREYQSKFFDRFDPTLVRIVGEPWRRKDVLGHQVHILSKVFGQDVPKAKKQKQQRQKQIDSVFRAVYGVESWLRPESEKHKLPPIEAFRLATENQVQRLLEARPERFARVRLNWDGNAENKRIKVGLFWRVDGCSDLT
jgi:hypothetical protein